MTAAAATGVFPKWVLLERYVFRRDDDESFPDDTVAPIRASGTTSWGADFRIAFSLADPPFISRLYAQLPGFPGPDEEAPLEIVATHRHLALLDIATSKPSEGLVQNLFIFKVDEKNPSSSSLRALPPTERYYDFRGDHRRRRSSSKAVPRELDSMRSGLWCGNKGQEFVVAELTVCVLTHGRTRIKAAADICLLRSSTDDQKLGRHKWDTKRVPILSTTDDDLWKLSHWQTNAVIPFQRWLCWATGRPTLSSPSNDGCAGSTATKASSFATCPRKCLPPTVSFLWFPLDSYCLTSTNKTPSSRNGGVSVIDHGRLLKFVYVARHDGGAAYGPLEPGTSFTITCHTLVLGSSMSWNLDYTVTSDNLREELRRGLPMYPRVYIDRPEVVHFLLVEFPKTYGKMSVLSIDMNKKTVLSCYLYMDGNEPNEAEDADFIIEKCLSPTPMRFLPCGFPRFCYLSRKRKDME